MVGCKYPLFLSTLVCFNHNHNLSLTLKKRLSCWFLSFGCTSRYLKVCSVLCSDNPDLEVNPSGILVESVHLKASVQV